MPTLARAQRSAWGASERFAVSPGDEANGYFHMPGGQSGHPLSRFYRAGHEAWVTGEPTPFLPGANQVLTDATSDTVMNSTVYELFDLATPVMVVQDHGLRRAHRWADHPYDDVRVFPASFVFHREPPGYRLSEREYA